MAIDYSLIRNVTARELVAALKRDGFFVRRQVGSHARYQHPDGRRVTVTAHALSYTFKRKTLKSMVEEQAKWDEADLRRLELIA